MEPEAKHLTAKQEAFAQAVANGATQSDAYRSSYSVKPTTKPDTIWARASELMASGKVRGRVSELREALAESNLWSREQSVKALRKVAQDSEKGGEIVAAVKELNSMYGYQAPANVNVNGSVSVRVTFG